jgi:hypothetical protein
MDIFTEGYLPKEVTPSFISTEQQGILDYVSPFGHLERPQESPITPMNPGRDPMEMALAKFASAPSSAGTKLAPVTFDWDKTNADRYVHGDDYKLLGFDPLVDNESKYGYHQTVGDVMQGALGGAWKLGATTFWDGWNGWVRMTDALFSWDASKLAGSAEELGALAKEQKDIMNKWAIYSTPESEEGIFNRQFFGNMVQQGGFMLGTMAQFLTEELLTFGMATPFSTLKLATKLGTGINRTIDVADAMNDMKRLGDIWKKANIVEGLHQGIKKLVPMADTISDMNSMRGAGATWQQLAVRGVGGLKRDLAEANMAFTEARMEAAGTYGDLYERLADDYQNRYGIAPDRAELEKISSLSQMAAWDNFRVNAGIIAASNRIQFDNLFSKFKVDRTLFGKVVAQGAKDVFEVTGKVAGKEVKRAFQKGTLGTIGAAGEIAATFGKKKAAWEVSKSIGRNLMKWEVSEGVQELMQETSNHAVQDYYSSLYNGNPASWSDSIEKGVEHQISMDGLKTFLMGAVTGRLMSPINFAATKGVDFATGAHKQNKDHKASIAESVGLINAFYDNPKTALPEWIANIKIQNKAAADMKEALENRDRYQYENAKDSAFAKTVAAAKKLNMLDSMLDTIRGYGEHLTDEEFKKAFDIEATKDNRRNAKELVNKVADDIEGFQKEFDRLYERYADTIRPELFKKGTQAHKEMAFAKHTLLDAIEVLATNRHKAGKAVERANKLMAEAAAVPGIGNSLATAYRTMTSESNTASEIQMLKEEIKALRDTPKKDQNTRDLLQQKEKMLLALEQWQEHSKVVDRRKKKTHAKAQKAFRDYILANQAKATVLPEDEVAEHYFQLQDHIQLNRDAQDSLDAYNIIANPASFAKFHARMNKGAMLAAEELKGEAIIEAMNSKEGFAQEHAGDYMDLMMLRQGELITKQQKDAYIQAINDLAEKADKYDPEDFKRRRAEQEAADARAAEEQARAAQQSGTAGTQTPAGGTPQGGNPVNPGASISAEELKGKAWSEKIQALKAAGVLTSVTIDGKEVDSVTYNGRVIYFLQVNGKVVPIYRSSNGTSGKTAGTWYNFFGFGNLIYQTDGKTVSSFGPAGWLIKGTGSDKHGEDVNYEKGYGIKELKEKQELFNQLFANDQKTVSDNLDQMIAKGIGVDKDRNLDVTDMNQLLAINKAVFGMENLNVYNDAQMREKVKNGEWAAPPSTQPVRGALDHIKEQVAAIKGPVNSNGQENLASKISAIVNTDENYNSWSNVRDGSDRASFIEQIESAVMEIEAVDTDKITAEAVDEYLKSIKAFHNKETREKVVTMLVDALGDKTNLENPASKPDPVLDQWVTDLQNVGDNHIALNEFLKKVATATQSRELTIEQGDHLANLIKQRLENLTESATFDSVTKGAILALKNGRMVIVTYKDDKVVKYKSYPKSKSNNTYEVKKADFDQNVNVVYNSENDYKSSLPKDPVTPEAQQKAATSQETNVDFINDQEARQKAIEEIQSKSSEDVAKDFLSSLGCK